MCVLGPVLGSGRDPGTPLWSQAVKQGSLGLSSHSWGLKGVPGVGVDAPLFTSSQGSQGFARGPV